MYAVGRLGSYIQRGVYRVSDPFHPFGGAVDIIVVQQEDGSFKSSRWNVRFGKFQGVLKTKERIVRISVNGVEADFNMYLDHKGEAYFLMEVDEEERESLLHPSTFSGDDTDDCSQKKKRAFKSKSCNFEALMSNSTDQFDVDKGKVLTTAGSRRSGILGFLFGRSPMKAGEYNGGDDCPTLTRVDSLERAEIAADLLEVKWSTNLTGLRPRKKDSSGFCAADNTETDSTTNMETGESDGNVCSNKEQVSFNAESSFQDCDAIVGETISLSANYQVVKHSEVGENMFESIGEVSEDTDAHTDRLGLQNPSVELEDYPHTHFVGEKNSSERIVGLPAIEIYKDFTTDDPQLFVHSEPLESSNRGMQCPTEVINLASERFRWIHIHSHKASAMLPQVTLTEESDPQEGEKGGPEKNSQKTDISCSCVGDFNDADAQRSRMSMKPETINSDHCIGFNSDFSNMCYKTRCSNDTRDIDIPNMFPPPLKSANDYGLTEATLKPPSISSSEENFIFGDLDEYKITEGQCTKSFSSEHVDQDNPPSSLDATEKDRQLISTNICLPLPPEIFVEESKTTDLKNHRVPSSPIYIQRNHSLDGELVEQYTGSLPIMSSHSWDLSQRGIHHPLSLSMDSREFHGKCVGADADKEKQFINDQQTKDMDISGMVNTIAASPTVEISLCKHLLYEGIGASAAAEAFDSKKLDVEKFRSLGPQVVKDERIVVRIGHCYFPWDAAAPIILGMASFGSERIFEASDVIPIEKNLDGDSSTSNMPSNGNWRLWPFSFRKSKSHTTISSLENPSVIPIEIDEEKVKIYPKVTKKTVKAYAPTSEQLASLNLKEGRNIVTFTFSTAMLGNQQVDARIYLWKWNTRIVISDVDGTITKSDVLGQFMPLVGIDWSQTGVAHLFSAIKENGYQLLFLSARAISQAFHTRRFLFNLKQDGKALPDGPVFISPDGVFPSLYREVIRRAPHEFKIACLEDIKALFPAGCNPFYAGFGNRHTDEISYLKVGIPKGKIFIINPKGEVAVNRRLDTKSYTSLHALVNGMFPPMKSSEQEDFNAWNYWKLPPPDIDI